MPHAKQRATFDYAAQAWLSPISFRSGRHQELPFHELVTGWYAFGALDDAIADFSVDSAKVMLVADDA
jgi:hypothetical protein